MVELKGSPFEGALILRGVRWSVAYPGSYWQLEEMVEERGVLSIIRRSIAGSSKNAPELDWQLRSHKRPVGSSRRLDGTVSG